MRKFLDKYSIVLPIVALIVYSILVAFEAMSVFNGEVQADHHEMVH
jgi:hypothetical protein